MPPAPLPGDSTPDERRMTIGEHLEELRKRVLWAVLYWVAMSGVAAWYSDGILGIVLSPFLRALEATRQPTELIYLEPTDSFAVVLKVILLVGAFLASPLIAWEIWGFVGKGLYGREKRWVVLGGPVSFLLFAAGTVFFYFWILPPALEFLYGYGRDFFPDQPGWTVLQKPNIAHAVAFFLWMALSMGLVFQIPLVMFLLNASGLVEAATFLRYQRHFIVAATIGAAILTPTGDAVNLGLFMIPILALYYLGLLAVFLRERGKRRSGA